MTWDDLTPVERRAGMWVKRDDLFRGPGGINGTKYRQLLRLTGDAVAEGAIGLLSAASGHSPQVPMTAIVARVLGVPCHIVTGAKSVESAMKNYSGVALAARYGATFEVVTPPSYNPRLQARGAEVVKTRPGWYQVPYAISLPEPATRKAAERFHDGSARQVCNLPCDLETLIIPCGSANSAASILYGLAREHILIPRIVLAGIGPSRLAWLEQRLALMDVLWIMDTTKYYDLTKVYEYGDKVRYNLDGIDLHPNYEAKVAEWFESYGTGWWGKPDTALWIVGDQPGVAGRHVNRQRRNREIVYLS